MKSIAIVSVGIRFPAAKSLDEFAKILEGAQDVVSRIENERWAERGKRKAEDEGFAHNKVYRVDKWQENAAGLNIPETLLQRLDPVFHLGIGAARDAFSGCKTLGYAKDRCGIIIGNIALPTEASYQLAADWVKSQGGLSFSRLDPVNLIPAAMPGLMIARALGISGNTFTLDAACASSLYALKLASDELMENRLDLVLAGGLSRPDPLFTQVGFHALGALSRAGVSRPLDARADGLMVGEGAGIFALKRLEDAERDGDSILAVIRGIGLSNDREGGLMAPSQEGQTRAMRAAYLETGWDPKTINLIECHATGTPLGDGTEIRSLHEIRGHAPAVIGSVKGNIGHMLTAAGTAGLAKLLLSLREKKCWPTANFEAEPESWKLAATGLRILKKAEPWQAIGPLRRAALSGFGFGGINAHLLLEEYSVDYSARPVPLIARKKVAVVRAADLIPRADYLELGYRQFRIPPKEMKEILPQQIASLLAMSSLGRLPKLDLNRVGIFFGVELDALTNLFAVRWDLQNEHPGIDFSPFMQPLQANQVMGSLASIVPSRCARELQTGGPSFTVAAAEASGLKALELAFRFVSRGDLEASLVLATDMVGSHRARSQLLERFGTQWLEAPDCSVALLLMDARLALELGLPVAVTLEAFLEGEKGLSLDGSAWSEIIPSHTQRVAATAQKVIVSSAYRGAAHGLHSLLKIWEKGESGRASYTLKGEHDLSVKWQQTGALTVSTSSQVEGESYQIPRKDQVLLPLNQLLQKPEPEPDEPQVPPVAADKAPVRGSAAQQILSNLLRDQLDAIAIQEQYVAFVEQGQSILATALELLNRTNPSQSSSWVHEPFNKTPPLYDYAACREFANGKIANVFGPDFTEIDSFSKRVRLPANRLLLCHRVMKIEGESKSMGPGKMTTEHDVYADAWYLEDQVMPTSICIESGQGDLMLSAFLGSDFQTRGNAGYRLLDARVCFFRELPRAGEMVRYEIEIKRFFEQNGTLFFQFSFEAFIDDKPMMSMVDGCAGFFTETALNEGRGVKRSKMQEKGGHGKVSGNYTPFVPLRKESLSDMQIEALRRGDYVASFGAEFAGLPLEKPKSLPGGDMKLVHRILEIDPNGGRYGIGKVIGEADMHPENWFLICHFIDDQVMPGTLMYECCLHTLRVFLMRSGWVGESGEQDFVPVPGIWSQLKCRGQVLATTKKATYEIEIKEIGYGPDAYVICDALMYADGKPIVDIIDMSLKIPHFTQSKLEGIWSKSQKKMSFTAEQVAALSEGDPSECFGPHYSIFNRGAARKMPRLPRPPFRFLDSVAWVEGPFMEAHVGTRLLAHYELPDDAWFWPLYNDALPLALLLEIALQPCGFLSAYMGTALQSPKDLKLRNLSGDGTLSQDVRRGSGRLSIEVAVTKMTSSGDFIIHDFAFRVFNASGEVYRGSTVFGMFAGESLNKQLPLHGVPLWEEQRIEKPYPVISPLPHGMICMVETWESAGEKVYGAKAVDPDEWYYRAHFFEDPIMPGSLGVEGLLQLLMAEANRRWPEVPRWRLALGSKQSWVYRAQVRLDSKEIRMALQIRKADDRRLEALGTFYCDGLPIYKVEHLSIEAANS